LASHAFIIQKLLHKLKHFANIGCFATLHMSIEFMFSSRQCSDIAVITTTLQDTTTSIEPTTTEQTTTTYATTTRQPTTTEQATTRTVVTTTPGTYQVFYAMK